MKMNYSASKQKKISCTINQTRGNILMIPFVYSLKPDKTVIVCVDTGFSGTILRKIK